MIGKVVRLRSKGNRLMYNIRFKRLSQLLLLTVLKVLTLRPKHKDGSRQRWIGSDCHLSMASPSTFHLPPSTSSFPVSTCVKAHVSEFSPLMAG